MKILAIRIKNLASLEGVNEIVFTEEPLCSAGIFAITGPTGAGKSTILDALCLALYAKTPRYRNAENGIEIADVQGSTIKQDDVRGILRDGTAEGAAEVDFIGVNGQRYSSRWSVKRARNKADGNLQSYEMTLRNLNSQRDVPGRKSELLAEIERLVGLNFEQFTRSVLLAQGDFTAFLKAGKDEKSSLLEKLTGSHVYSEISIKVFEHHKEQQQKVRDLKAQCGGIAQLTDEELAALQAQKAEMTADLAIKEQQIDGLGKEILWHQQWSKLQEAVEDARIQYEQSNAAKTEAQPRALQLLQIDRVQSVKPIIGNLQNVQDQLLSKSRQSEELELGLIDLKHQREVLDIVIRDTNDDLDAKILEQEQAIPLLNTAKALDVQLSEKDAQIKQVAQDLEVVRDKQNKQAEHLAKTQMDLDVLQAEITKLDKWKTEHLARQSVAEQETMILSKLADAGSIVQSLNDYESRLQATEGQINSCIQKKQILEVDRVAALQAHQQIKETLDALHTAVSDTDLQALESAKARIDAFVEDIISAEAHWKILYSTLKEEDILLRALESDTKDLEQSTAKFIEATRLLEIRKAERDIALKSLERAKLRSTQSVEALRGQLEPQEPCPVCGSTTHPYVAHHYGLDLVINELETTYKQTEEAYSKLLAAHSSLQEVCSQLKKSISSHEVELVRKRASLDGLQKIWPGFLIYDSCMQLPIEERAAWLQQQLQNQKAQQKELHAQIQSFAKQRQQLESYKTDLAELDRKLNHIDNDIKDIERTLKSLREQKANDTSEQQKAQDKLEAIKKTLSSYLSSEHWYQNWYADPEVFTRRIKQFADLWKANVGKLEDNIQTQSVLMATLQGMQEQFDHIGEEVKLFINKQLTLQEQRNAFAVQRKAIFNGASASDVEERLKEAVLEARKTQEQKRKESEKLQDDITKHIAKNEQLAKDKMALLQQETKLKEQLNSWLNDYNLQYNASITIAGLLPLLEFAQDWIEKERKDLRAIDDALTQAKSVWLERNNSLESHIKERPSDKTLDELKVLEAEALATFKQDSQAVHDIDFKIREDDANKKRIGHLLQDIEKQSKVVDNWAKLNDIIGSADGKKFRQIAQEYTLDVLLSYANVHLADLSKRYILQRIPNSLGLQVLDQDMGDEIRTVYSLSGGESFLVSLALALGLASLSSNRMKVESLFIDEGFGSLDPNTLNIAMDALERLHNQGRKVGVISHVQEMTERIPIQIKVSKQQSGKSKVEVVSL